MVNVQKISFNKKGIKCLLSPLEADILELLWKRKNAKVRDIYNILKNKRKVALTSVAVILNRLHKKKIVTRKIEKGRGGGHYIYKISTDKKHFQESIIESTVNKLITSFGPTAVSYFDERFSKRDKR